MRLRQFFGLLFVIYEHYLLFQREHFVPTNDDQYKRRKRKKKSSNLLPIIFVGIKT
jgi:hypothetical protein